MSTKQLSLAAVIDHIWCESNRKIFLRQRLSSGDLITKIHDDLRAYIISWRCVKMDESRSIWVNWKIPSVVFLDLLGGRCSAFLASFVCLFYLLLVWVVNYKGMPLFLLDGFLFFYKWKLIYQKIINLRTEHINMRSWSDYYSIFIFTKGRFQNVISSESWTFLCSM